MELFCSIITAALDETLPITFRRVQEAARKRAEISWRSSANWHNKSAWMPRERRRKIYLWKNNARYQQQNSSRSTWSDKELIKLWRSFVRWKFIASLNNNNKKKKEVFFCKNWLQIMLSTVFTFNEINVIRI